MAKIYVASSWRNTYYPEVVKKLREYGHEVYDFRNPPHNHGAFMWKDIDPEFDRWNVEQYKQGLQHPSSERQFQADLDALNWADTCLLVLPCGRSAHTEAGWMKGAGKKVIVYIPEMQEAELMYKLFDLVSGDLDEINGIIYTPYKDVKADLYLQSGARPVHCQWGRELRAPKVCCGICEREYRSVRMAQEAQQATPADYPLGMESHSEETAHQ